MLAVARGRGLFQAIESSEKRAIKDLARPQRRFVRLPFDTCDQKEERGLTAEGFYRADVGLSCPLTTEINEITAWQADFNTAERAC